MKRPLGLAILAATALLLIKPAASASLPYQTIDDDLRSQIVFNTWLSFKTSLSMTALLFTGSRCPSPWVYECSTGRLNKLPFRVCPLGVSTG